MENKLKEDNEVIIEKWEKYHERGKKAYLKEKSVELILILFLSFFIEEVMNIHLNGIKGYFIIIIIYTIVAIGMSIISWKTNEFNYKKEKNND